MPRKFKRYAQKKRKTVKQQATQAVKRQLARQAEKKYLDVGLSQTITTSGSIINLGLISQGDGVSNREGNKVRVKNIHARFSLTVEDATNIVRVIFFRDTNSHGVAPNVSNFLTNWYDPLNSINVPHRFKVISDRTYTLISNSDVEVRTLNRNLKIDKALNYANTSTSPYQNALYMLAISDSSVSGPAMAGTARVYFTDL